MKEESGMYLSVREVVLASGSSSRRRLLDLAGVRHIVDKPDLDEQRLEEQWKEEDPERLAERLASEKVLKVSERHEKAVVLGGDQVLYYGGRVLHKPVDREGALDRLRLLRGGTHELYAGVAGRAGDGELWTQVCRARLKMRNFSNGFLEEYGNLMGDEMCLSVGGYHFEGAGIQLFESVEGDYGTILGFPLLPVMDFLRSVGALRE